MRSDAAILSHPESLFTLLHARAPARIDLAGGWSDVPPFSVEEGGAVVSAAIDRYTHVRLQAGGKGVKILSADYGCAVEVSSVAALAYDGSLDLVKAALKRYGPQSGVELAIRSDVPTASGLGTSGSVGVAVVGVLDSLAGGGLGPLDIAAAATRLETEELGIAGGSQDQLAAALGGLNLMQFGSSSPVIDPLHVAPAALHQMESRMILCYSGHSRLSGDIVRQVQAAYLRRDGTTRGALIRLRELAYRLRDLLEGGRVEQLGALLAENWSCQRALHPAVSTPLVETLFEVAMESGALGGKACGAGGGGCLVFFCSAGAVDSVRDALVARGGTVIPFRVVEEGLRRWKA